MNRKTPTSPGQGRRPKQKPPVTKTPRASSTRPAHVAKRREGLQVLRFPAIEMRQGRKRRLYCFAVDGKQVLTFATVSRLHRDEENAAIGGYQRPEVLSHINEIRDYVESTDPMIPNAVVVAFDRRVTFEPSEVQPVEAKHVRIGTLTIPFDDSSLPEDRPGWIVDGQQRIAAIRDSVLTSFPIFVTAFVTDSPNEQREQFILVNSTKPLPKGLIYELLPSTTSHLPVALERKRFPAFLLDRLNHDPDSPLKGAIRTPTSFSGRIKDNSILRMLEHSLGDGALYNIRPSPNGSADIPAMLTLLKAFWNAVAQVFAADWELPPRRSRLVHGAGILALGFLMDAITDRYRRTGLPTSEQFVANLEPIARVCHWSHGEWAFAGGQRRQWHEIQNTPTDIELVVDYLLSAYRTRVWSRTKQIAAAG